MKSNNKSRIITNLINSWVNEYLDGSGIVSDKTLKNYKITLILFISFLESEKAIDATSICPNNFNSQILEEWIRWLIEVRNCLPSTCNVRLSAIRTFLKYVARKDISLSYLYQEAINVPFRKVQKTKVKGISKEAMKVLLRVPNQNTKTGRMYLTLFALMYNTGVRLDEILSLQMKNLKLNIKIPQITVVGKGNKIRTIGILPRTVLLLEKYSREFHRGVIGPEDYVFYSRNLGRKGKLSQTAINKQLKKYAKLGHDLCSEIPLNFHCHQIRHSAASHWLDNGMNIIQISTILGHSCIQTTMVYLDISINMQAKALEMIEDPKINIVIKKWKKKSTLSELCGLSPLNQIQ